MRTAALLLAAILAAGCDHADPPRSGQPLASESGTGVPSAAAIPSPSTDPAAAAAIEALTGLAVKGIDNDGNDLVLRIAAPGFRLPDNEHMLDVHGERVLSAKKGEGGGPAILVIRDLDGNVIRELDAGMRIPQSGIVRGDDVYFAGVDVAEGADPLAEDRGAWVAHGDAEPERLLKPAIGVAIYHSIDRSPDGRTIGIHRCADACATTFVRADLGPVVVADGGLIALGDSVALLIDNLEVRALSITDGAELWKPSIKGLLSERFATTEGERFVMATIGPPAGGGGSTDELRIQLLEAGTGKVLSSTFLSMESALVWVEPALSTDRYLALLGVVLANPDDGPDPIRVIDLSTGLLLDVELSFGPVPPA